MPNEEAQHAGKIKRDCFFQQYTRGKLEINSQASERLALAEHLKKAETNFRMPLTINLTSLTDQNDGAIHSCPL